jgi:hypothetical protein
MTGHESTGNAPFRRPEESGEKGADRDGRGRLLPGHAIGAQTRFGTPGNPPPKSPGRPKKGAWLRSLEARLAGEPRLGQALADRLLKIALKGPEGPALRAIQEIEDRTGEPIGGRVIGMSDREVTLLFNLLLDRIVSRLPPEYHRAVREAAFETLAGDESPWLVIESGDESGDDAW